MERLPKSKVLYGFALACFGLILTVAFLLILGNNPLFTPVITIYASFGLGVYFLGLGIVANGLISRYDTPILIHAINNAVSSAMNRADTPTQPTLPFDLNKNSTNEHEDPLKVLIEIRDILKKPEQDTTGLSHATFILTWVIAIATLLLIGNDIWKAYGWPLPVLWMSTFTLIIFSIWLFIGILQKKSNTRILQGALIIGGIGLILVVLVSNSNIPQSAEGNITNIYENGSFPQTTLVNNYNVTIISYCNNSERPLILVEDLKLSMRNKVLDCR
jgi:hypothetical protein